MFAEVISWLNENKGFVTALSTMAYIGATLALVILNYKNLSFYRDAERRKYRPLASFDIFSKPPSVLARLTNHGPTPAFNVKVNVAPELHGELGGKRRKCPLTDESINFMPPGKELSDVVELDGSRFEQNYPELAFKVKVTYRDWLDVLYEEEFTVNLTAQRRLTHIGEKEVGTELEKIREILKKMTSPQFKPLVRTISEEHFQEAERQKAEEARIHLKEKETGGENEKSG